MTDTAENAEVWVPLTGSGRDEDPWRPDVPAGIPWETHCSLPGPIGPELADAPRNKFGLARPLVSFVCVTVQAADAARVTTAVPLGRVPAEDRLTVELHRQLARDHLGRLTAASEQAIAAVLRREASVAATDDARALVLALLKRMRRRGLPGAVAREVTQALAAKG